MYITVDRVYQYYSIKSQKALGNSRTWRQNVVQCGTKPTRRLVHPASAPSIQRFHFCHWILGPSKRGSTNCFIHSTYVSSSTSSPAKLNPPPSPPPSHFPHRLIFSSFSSSNPSGIYATLPPARLPLIRHSSLALAFLEQPSVSLLADVQPAADSSCILRCIETAQGGTHLWVRRAERVSLCS